MAILRITNDDEMETFRRQTDVKGMTLEILLDNGIVRDTHWGRTSYNYDHCIVARALKNLAFGESETRVYLYQGPGSYSGASIGSMSIHYNNASFNFEQMNTEGTHPLELRHLIKPRGYTYKIFKEDKNWFLSFDWDVVYKEIIRINDREKKTTKREEVTKFGRDIKIMSVLGHLENDGITDMKISYGSIQSNVNAFGSNIHIYLDKKDSGRILDVTDNLSLTVNIFGRTYDTNYKTALKYCKIFNKITEELGKEDE